jgi:hypothetical protein
LFSCGLSFSKKSCNYSAHIFSGSQIIQKISLLCQS